MFHIRIDKNSPVVPFNIIDFIDLVPPETRGLNKEGAIKASPITANAQYNPSGEMHVLDEWKTTTCILSPEQAAYAFPPILVSCAFVMFSDKHDKKVCAYHAAGGIIKSEIIAKCISSEVDRKDYYIVYATPELQDGNYDEVQEKFVDLGFNNENICLVDNFKTVFVDNNGNLSFA